MASLGLGLRGVLHLHLMGLGTKRVLEAGRTGTSYPTLPTEVRLRMAS